MSKPRKEPQTEEPKEELLTWEQVIETVGKVLPIVRIVGNKKYQLEYLDIQGEEYQNTILRIRTECTTDGKIDQKRFNFRIASELKGKIIRKVCGKDYEPIMDRQMPAWMLSDIEEFIGELTSGKV